MIWLILIIMVVWFVLSTMLWLRHHETFVFGGVHFVNLNLIGMVLYGPGCLVMSIFMWGLGAMNNLSEYMRKP